MKKVVMSVVVLLVAVGLARQPLRGEGKFVMFPPLEPVTFGDSTHHFDVRFYRVDLNLPMSNSSYTGHIGLELVPRHVAFDTFSLNMVNLVCDSVRRAGNTCTFTTPSNRLLITLDRQFANGESLVTDIYYHRNTGGQLRGFYRYSAGQTGYHVLAYTTTEPQDSRYWLPCFDEPWDKAERGCAINVTVPETLSVASNGLLDSVTANAGAHTKTYWWRHPYPISTYLLTFAASKWASFKQWFHYSPTESAYVQNFVWPEDSSDAVAAYANVIDMVDYFSDSLRYGRYPFEKYGMVEAYPFQWGGMENQTMTMVHHNWVQFGYDNGIAHELSHQWWGDMVTCQDWRDIWLNEGFATYSDEQYEYHQNGRSAFLTMIGQRAQDYFDEEAQDPRPVYAPPIDNLFTWGHTYCKAAWVQHMLRYLEADTNWASPGLFFRAMRAYGDSFKYGSVNTQDYRRIHEQMSGLELGWFFDEWIYEMGYPTYNVGWHGRQTQDGWQVVMNIEQNNGSGFPDCFHMPVEVRVSWAGGSGIYRVPVETNPQYAVIDVPNQPTALTVDPNDWILDVHSTQVGTAEEPEYGVVPKLVALGPNPARAEVRLAYVLPRKGSVHIGICDAAGRLVRTLESGTVAAGRHGLTWDRTDHSGRKVGAGVHVVRFEAGEARASRRLVLLD